MVVVIACTASCDAAATSYTIAPWETRAEFADFIGVVECIEGGATPQQYRVIDAWKGSENGAVHSFRVYVPQEPFEPPVTPSDNVGDRFLFFGTKDRRQDDKSGRPDFVVSSLGGRAPLPLNTLSMFWGTGAPTELSGFKKAVLAYLAVPIDQREGWVLRSRVREHLLELEGSARESLQHVSQGRTDFEEQIHGAFPSRAAARRKALHWRVIRRYHQLQAIDSLLDSTLDAAGVTRMLLELAAHDAVVWKYPVWKILRDGRHETLQVVSKIPAETSPLGKQYHTYLVSDLRGEVHWTWRRTLSPEFPPPVLAITGVLHDDDRVVISSVREFSGDRHSGIQRGTGEYTIALVADKGYVIDRFPINGEFKELLETTGEWIATDSVVVGVELRYPGHTARVRFVRGDKILAEFDPVVRTLRGALTSIPDRAYADKPRQRRRALLRKLDAFETILTEDKPAALDKLNKDIRKHVEQWVIDDQGVPPAESPKARAVQQIDYTEARIRLRIRLSAGRPK